MRQKEHGDIGQQPEMRCVIFSQFGDEFTFVLAIRGGVHLQSICISKMFM